MSNRKKNNSDTNRHQRSQGEFYKRTMDSDSIPQFYNSVSGSHFRSESTGFSQFIGSSPLQHNSPKYTIPKCKRFNSIRKLYNESQLILPSTRNDRSTALGYGKKEFIPVHMLKNAEANPSPNAYFAKEQIEKGKKDEQLKPEMGKTFGLSFQSYKAVYVPNTNLVNLQLSKQLPGVGQYTIQQETGKDKLSYTMGPHTAKSIPSINPPPNRYNPKFVLTEKRRFDQVSQGVGPRKDFTYTAARKNPDPHAYEIPSVFDKFDKKFKDRQNRILERRVTNMKKQFYKPQQKSLFI